jgi:hypothetical protein
MQTASSSIFERAEKIGEFSQLVPEAKQSFHGGDSQSKMCKFKQSPSNTMIFMVAETQAFMIDEARQFNRLCNRGFKA